MNDTQMPSTTNLVADAARAAWTLRAQNVSRTIWSAISFEDRGLYHGTAVAIARPSCVEDVVFTVRACLEAGISIVPAGWQYGAGRRAGCLWRGRALAGAHERHSQHRRAERHDNRRCWLHAASGAGGSGASRGPVPALARARRGHARSVATSRPTPAARRCCAMAICAIWCSASRSCWPMAVSGTACAACARTMRAMI